MVKRGSLKGGFQLNLTLGDISQIYRLYLYHKSFLKLNLKLYFNYANSKNDLCKKKILSERFKLGKRYTFTVTTTVAYVPSYSVMKVVQVNWIVEFFV